MGGGVYEKNSIFIPRWECRYAITTTLARNEKLYVL